MVYSRKQEKAKDESALIFKDIEQGRPGEEFGTIEITMVVWPYIEAMEERNFVLIDGLQCLIDHSPVLFKATN